MQPAAVTVRLLVAVTQTQSQTVGSFITLPVTGLVPVNLDKSPCSSSTSAASQWTAGAVAKALWAAPGGRRATWMCPQLAQTGASQQSSSWQGGTEISLKMCNMSRVTSANHSPKKKECSVAVNYSPNMLKTIWSCWGLWPGRPVCPWVGNELLLILEEKQSKYRYLFRKTLLSPSGDCCIRRVNLLFTSGSDAGFKNLWLRRLKDD